MTPISTVQRATLRFLREQRRTVAEIKTAMNVNGGVQGMLQSLNQQGMIRYVGGPGIRLGHGWWELTVRGRTIAEETTS